MLVCSGITGLLPVLISTQRGKLEPMRLSAWELPQVEKTPL